MAGGPDLSEFIRLSKPKKQLTCQVAEVIDKMSPAESKQLVSALGHDHGVITNKAIQLWLEARGHSIIWQRILVHRKHECVCGQ